MLKRTFRLLIAAIGLVIGYALAELLISNQILVINSSILSVVYYSLAMIAFAVILYIFAPLIIRWVEKLVDSLERMVLNQPKETVLIGLVGFIIGIILAFLLSFPLTRLVLPTVLDTGVIILSVILYVVLASLGYRLAIKNKDEIYKLFSKKKSRDDNEKPEREERRSRSYSNSDKVLDTSVIIDGRIKQIAETGFLEGNIIVPNFVLEELQLIADSADDLKRERGRRGLDIVKDLQNSSNLSIKLTKKDYKDLKEVDVKLLRFASETGAAILTNDYNLNKLAQVQGIKVLNINELANSVKTVVIPGEIMRVNVIKEGKEKNQGLAYLEDGTMIVVEDGRHLIGQEIDVVVTTVLQTAAGKMIFTRVK